MGYPATRAQEFTFIPVNQSIYEPSSEKKALLGTRLVVGERVFYYAKAGANVSAGQVVCAPNLVASHYNGNVTIASANAGDKNITVSVASGQTDISKNQYEDGYLVFYTGALAGQMYHIKNNDAVSAGSSGVIRLYDGLAAAITSSTAVELIPNPYNAVQVGTASDLPVGVAPIAASSGQYLWIQTYGLASVNAQANLTSGAAIALSTGGGVADAFDGVSAPGATVYIVGKNLERAVTAGDERAVFLTIKA